LSKGYISNISGMDEGIKLKLSGHIEGAVENLLEANHPSFALFRFPLTMINMLR
jgi:hypothetical protein